MAGQQEAQRNQLAQQQLLSNKQQMETGALQQQKAQLELADYKTKQEGLDKFVQLSAANGKTGSPKEMASSFYDFALAQKDPQLIMSAQTMMQAANERERFQAYQKSQQTIPAQKAPAPMAGELGTGTFGLDTIPSMPNALASRAAAPMAATNALAPQAADPVAALETQIAQLRTFNDPLAQAEATRLQKQVDEYNKGQIVPPGSTFVVGRKPVFTAPKEAAPVKTIGTVNPGDFTSASVANFNKSGNYEDLIPKPTKVAGDGAAKAPSGYRFTKTGDLEAIPGGPGVSKPVELKQVPVHAQKAIVGASTAIKKIDDAITALESSTKEATGMKGYLPDMALNRMYPEGTEARAAVADIGSLVMHERSGAAVTASESPRLKPFIPLITDDKLTALKKLRRMRQIQADDAEALAGTYNSEQGFREFKVATPAAAPAGVDAALWNVMTPEEKKLWQK